MTITYPSPLLAETSHDQVENPGDDLLQDPRHDYDKDAIPIDATLVCSGFSTLLDIAVGSYSNFGIAQASLKPRHSGVKSLKRTLLSAFPDVKGVGKE